MTKKERENDEIRKWKGLHHKIAEWHGSIKEKNRFLHVTDKAEETRFLYGSFSGLVSFPTFFLHLCCYYIQLHTSTRSSSTNLFQTNDLLQTGPWVRELVPITRVR